MDGFYFPVNTSYRYYHCAEVFAGVGKKPKSTDTVTVFRSGDMFKEVRNEVRFTPRFLGCPCIWVVSWVGQFFHVVVSIKIKLVCKQYDVYLTT